MRELFMALLAGSRGYGYEIKQALDAEFGEVLPAVNAGQVYSTLARLEREGLVSGVAVPGDSRGKREYQLTDDGWRELQQWIGTPVAAQRLKDEFFMKFVVVTAAGLADAVTLIDGQRREYLQSLRDLDQTAANRDLGLAAQLLIEGEVLHLKADIEWLELIESQLRDWGN